MPIPESVLKVQKSITDKYGPYALMVGDKEEQLKIDFISSGLLNVDLATKPHRGPGGIPRGKLVEVFGPEASGKTSLALSTIAEAQKMGLVCGLFDAENGFNSKFARDNFNVNIEDLIISQSQEGETVLDTIEALVMTGDVDLLVLDSVASLPSIKVLKEDNSQDHVATEARMWSQALKKLKAKLNRYNCTLILINQLREDPGKMFGNPETTPGGRAIKFYSDMRIEVKARKPFYEGSGDTREEIGHLLRIRIIKNKVGTKGGYALVDFYNESGFDKDKALMEAGLKTNAINRGGAWYSYEPISDELPEFREQGKDAFFKAISEYEDQELLMNDIQQKILGGNKIEVQDQAG